MLWVGNTKGRYNMNEMITINYDNPQRPVVSGRELHAALQIETRYNDWFKRMCEYGFSESNDFYSFLSKSLFLLHLYDIIYAYIAHILMKIL